MKNAKELLKALDKTQLEQKIEELRREIFTLRITSVTTPVKDTSQFGKLRKDLARALTFLRQKNMQKV